MLAFFVGRGANLVDRELLLLISDKANVEGDSNFTDYIRQAVDYSRNLI